MSGPLPILQALDAGLKPHGLHRRGLVDFPGGEGGPSLLEGRPARQVVLIGNIGGSCWQPFCTWRNGQPDGGGDHPLDAWSKRVIGEIAKSCGATAYFPSDPPYQPFQGWGMKAEGLKASPLGILIHPDYGLWHGYRGALGFAGVLEEACQRPHGVHPCDACDDKPCLKTCPVAAVSEGEFDVGGCRRYLATREGRDGCMARGCIARAACPVGSSFRYPEGQLRFHMEALGLPSG